ncbi:hypothetical protein ACGTNG_12535 [Halomonas sp. 1390]|uniref:hypothetical protein n=1 Tax=Halomonas sp. B23F22_3 TaxID=3459516 RepID=UPI00373F670C
MSQSAYIRLGGGIDLVTPPEQLSPGAAIYAVNYECPISGGYRRIEGYAQLGPAVPGEGPVLGVVTFNDKVYAVRKDVGADSATLYVLNTGTDSWDVVGTSGALHNGRHEFVEGNVKGLDKDRALYGVGGGKPFQLMAEQPGAQTFEGLVELTAYFKGSPPEGVTYRADNDTLTLSDEDGRTINGVEVQDKSGTTLSTEPDTAAGGDNGTEVAIDFTGIDVNNVGHVLFTVGSEPATTLTIPELADPFTEITAAQAGATFIALHSNHLFLGYEQGSVQHSDLGNPVAFNAATGGAAEIAVGQALTGLLSGTGGALHFICRDSVKTLYGTSAADWQLKTTVPNSGGRPYSAQSLVQPYFIAERGIASLEATNAYGDFRPMQPGAKVEPLFTADGYASRVVASAVSKSAAQYRVWFDDATGIYMSPTGITRVQYPAQVAVAHTGELSSGAEQILFGDDAGNVYRLDNGATSFNGADIEAFLTLAYNDLESPNIRKRFRRVFWDVRSGSNANIAIQPDLDYGGTETARQRRAFIQFLLGGGLWGVDDWNEINWSVPSLGQEPMDITGTGVSVNFAIYSKSSSASHELLGYDVHFDPRRRRRG